MRASGYARLRLCDDATERELLGCLLVDVDLRRVARRMLRPDDFNLYHHRLIYHAILTAGPAEFYRIGAALADHPLVEQVGGADYIRDLAVNVENYAAGTALMHDIVQLGRQRRVLQLAEDMARAAVSGHLDGISNWMNRKLKFALRNTVYLNGAGRQMQLPGLVAPRAEAGPSDEEMRR